MSDVRWIKVSVAMFDDEKIRLIEALPDADSILVIWMKLLTLAAKVNAGGHIYLNETMPYTEEMLATVFHRKVNTVRLALETFSRFGMIGVTANRNIVLTNWAKHQNIEGLDKIRADNRARQKKRRGCLKNGIPLEDGDPDMETVTLPSRDSSRDITQQNKKKNGNVTSHVTLEEEKEEEPPTVPQGGQASEPDLISDKAEAKRLICEKVFPGKNPDRPWSFEAMDALARILPIPRHEIDLVGWFHRLPAEEAVHELKVRRKSEGTLLPNWSDEETRAAAYRKKIGGGTPPTVAKKEPALWREFFRWKYPECHLPTTFAEISSDLRNDWRDEHAGFEELPEWWQPAATQLYGEGIDLPRSILKMTPSARADILAQIRKNQSANKPNDKE